MNWQDVGEEMRECWARRVSDYAERAMPEGHAPDELVVIFDGVPLKPGFGDALSNFARGNPSRLVAYLRSDRPLGRSERNLIAEVLDQNQSRPGRPTNDLLRTAATAASRFFDAWRTANKERGIKDHGRRGEMKSYAARVVVEDYYAWQIAADPEQFIESVRSLMDRPKRRRNVGANAFVTFPVSAPHKGRQNSG